jgi:hypothetical protein
MFIRRTMELAHLLKIREASTVVIAATDGMAGAGQGVGQPFGAIDPR